MQKVSLDGKLEIYGFKGKFIDAKLKGRKVKLKLALSDNSTFVMRFNLDKIEGFNKFTSLVEDFFNEQPYVFDIDAFLERRCKVCIFEVYFGGRTKRRIDSIEPLKDEEDIKQNEPM